MRRPMIGRVDGEHAGGLAAEHSEALYLKNRPLLLYIAVRKFGLPEEVAESLLHEVFLCFLQTSSLIHDPARWLMGATCNAARAYLRGRARTRELPHENDLPPAADDLRTLELQLTLRNLLRILPEKARTAVRMRYLEQRGYPEIAEALHISEAYAEKLVFASLRRLRRWHAPPTATNAD